MKIVGVFFNPEIRTGGHRRYLEFFQATADKGHEVILLVNRKLKYSFTGVNVLPITYDYRKKVIPYSFYSLYRLYREKGFLVDKINQCDFIVIHGETHLFAGAYLKRIFRSNLLFALRSNGVVEAQMKRKERGLSIFQKAKQLLLESKYRFYERFSLRCSDLMAFQSSFDKNSVISRNKGYESKAVIIPGNIGGAWFDPSLRDTNNSKSASKLVYVGAINQRKGTKYLLEAFLKLVKEGYDLKLVVIGDGDQRASLEELVFKDGRQDQVVFLGKVKKPLEYVSGADLMVVPSVFDSFPDVVLESLHVGTPVIASRSGGLPEMLDAEDIFEVASSESLYLKLKQIISDSHYYGEMKKRLKLNRMRFDFNWALAFLDEMEVFLNSKSSMH